ncbi:MULTISPECIES: DUF1697 domain-containing protein [unclassified Microbacterium]|uniref:DUF1697 domain-containing protein n=1 Tax=unclassified Microbacterium TaxID=2609290 RepID=UPI00214BD367|nr:MULTISPECIES: DUF1697 domain-containing protein [unclassified Microbacterium]MCR2784667.1 DUF1697 domain-containing protein [Microbacterium sp. zg.B96]WIM16209.1 DUF1697 domain-containing protein [Microbacterium sp. zg-B96]
MATYLAFLRAINLGAKRVFPQGDIRRVVTDAGFADAATHINTGNVRFTTAMRSRARIEDRLERAFAADRGFEVPTIVFAAGELAAIADTARELNAARPELARHYVYLLKEQPSAAAIEQIESTSSDLGEMIVRGRAAHALLQPGYEAGRVDPLRAAKLLGVATNRNFTVISALAERWC